ncbi:hypothetical protein K8I85_19175 [bacterium]|nr:hypothetical protein [bacterium]
MTRMCRRWIVAPLAGILLVTAASAAADDGSEAVEGTVSVGGHASDLEGTVGKAGEFGLYRESIESDLRLDLLGRSGTRNLELRLDVENEIDRNAFLRVHGPQLDVRFDHQSFRHWLDHDRLENVEFREALAGGAPGGKMATHEDLDPDGVYGIDYTDTRSHLAAQLPVPEGTDLAARFVADFRDMRRQGTKQSLGVDHCSNCHVRSHAGRVDERTRDLALGLEGEREGFAFSYRFAARDFDNLAAAGTNRYMQARHPGNGGSEDEFASRTIYENEELTFGQVPDVEKRGHTVRASADLPRSQSVRGTFSMSTVENQVTGLDLQANAAALSWFAPLSKRTRVTAGVVRRELENDPYDVDLPLWRDGRAGGGQDFDWVRESAYDRVEWIGTARLAHTLRPGQNVRLDYRFHSTDRDNVLLDPDSDKTRTTRNRLKASWSGSLARKARSRVEVTYEMTDLPFVAVGGLCEPALSDSVMPIDDSQPSDWIYYFQRERYGTGGNLPTKALRGRVQFDGSVGPKLHASAYVSASDEKNDDLNLYDFERSVLSPGVSLLFVPTEAAIFTGGAAYSRIESNAKLCATVMDG